MLNPAVGSTLAVIRGALAQLGPRERAVADALLHDPALASRMGAAELAAFVGTSAATVTRACQSIGFSGYPHLRTLLVRDAGAAEHAARANGEPESILHGMFAEAARELGAAPAAIDLVRFRQAVDLLTTAQRIVIIGAGGSASTLLSSALRFMTVGIGVDAPSEPILQLLLCRLLGPGDVVLAISDSGENTATLPSVDAARQSGASVVAVTSFSRSTLARAADIPLVVGATGRPWPESVLTSTMLQTFLLNALVSEVAAARGRPDDSEELFGVVVRAVTGNRRPGAEDTDSSSVNS